MTITKADLERRLASAERRLRAEHKKSAATNRENERLRKEIRTMRVANYTLNRSLDPGIQQGYIRRYEAAREALSLISEIISTTQGHGLEVGPPTTLEPWLGPHWARTTAAN